MDLKQLVKSFTVEALELSFLDALKRGDETDREIVSDELFERKLKSHEKN